MLILCSLSKNPPQISAASLCQTMGTVFEAGKLYYVVFCNNHLIVSFFIKMFSATSATSDI